VEFIAAKRIRVGEFAGWDQGRIGLIGRKSMAGDPFLTSHEAIALGHYGSPVGIPLPAK
jgi:hypothetical protein